VTARTCRTNSEEETIALGERLGHELPPGVVVFLIGGLGAGKTTLAKGIAKGFCGAEPEEVSSPTFTLVQEYGDPPEVYHIDLYRLEEEREAASLGLEELFDRDAAVLVEWGERFPNLFPLDRFEIEMRRLSDESREIEIRPPAG